MRLDSERITTYIFDLDDTLYDEETYVISALSNVCKYLSKKYQINYDEILDYCLKSIRDEGRGNTFNKLCSAFSLDENIQDLVKIYRETRPVLVLYEDSKDLFKELQLSNKLIGIITDGNAKVQTNKIQALGLDCIADAIIVTDEYSQGDNSPLSKPDERVYKMCLDRLGVNAKEAVYIGDNPLKDFAGAKKIGMKTVRIIRDKGMFMKEKAPSKEYEADYTIHSLIELID